MIGLVPLQGEIRAPFLPAPHPCHVRTQQEGSYLEAGRDLSPDSNYAGT